MKALSVRQPWAWLIVHGGKDIENRTWRTDYRGPLLIHASAFRHCEQDLAALRWIRLRFGNLHGFSDMPLLRRLERGGIIGRVFLQGCVREDSSPWFEGPWGWQLSRPEALPFQAMKGSLGLFEATP